MIETVIFDLDDTLYAEIEYCKSGFAAVAAHLAQSPQMPSESRIFEALWTQFTGGNRSSTFNSALEDLEIGYDSALIKSLVRVYREHNPTLELPEESRRILDELSQDYALAMLTDGFMPAQQLKVRALGIEPRFQCIIYTEQLGREFWKPSPVGFQRILDKLRTDADSTVYVGDNEEKDFIAPNQLGMDTIKLDKPQGMHKKGGQTPIARPKRTITSLSELPALLREQ